MRYLDEFGDPALARRLLHEIERSVTEAGFSRVTVERVPLTVRIPSASAFARGLVFGNPLHDEILARGGVPEAVYEAMTEAIERRLGDEMPLQAIVISASKE